MRGHDDTELMLAKQGGRKPPASLPCDIKDKEASICIAVI